MAEPPGKSAPGSTDQEEALRRLRHDLANPLAAVLAETQLLLLSPEQFNAETLTALQQIETLARKMRRILQDTDV
jgi:signal transduction histidine kinase